MKFKDYYDEKTTFKFDVRAAFPNINPMSEAIDNVYKRMLNSVYGRQNSTALIDYIKEDIKNTRQLVSNFGRPQIKNVIFNPPATIVFWTDDTKTVVKADERDTFDPEKGLAMAISKKYFDNKGNYYKQFAKWLPEEEETTVEENIPMSALMAALNKMKENALETRKAIESLAQACTEEKE